MKNLKLILLLFLVCTSVLYGGNLPADSSDIKTQKFNRNIYDSLSKRLDYSKDRIVETKYSKTNKPTQLLSDDTKKTIAYTLIILALIFFLFQIFRNDLRSKDKKIKNNLLINEISDEEKEIHFSDLDARLKNAVEDSNYKLAIRIQYLMAIRDLTRLNWIKWKKEKTNHDYLEEISEHEFFRQFAVITSIFERIWYGDQIIEKDLFENYTPLFIDFLSSIAKKQSIG